MRASSVNSCETGRPRVPDPVEPGGGEMPISGAPLEGFEDRGGGVTRVEAIQAGIPSPPKIARVKSRVTLNEGKVLAAL